MQHMFSTLVPGSSGEHTASHHPTIYKLLLTGSGLQDWLVRVVFISSSQHSDSLAHSEVGSWLLPSMVAVVLATSLSVGGAVEDRLYTEGRQSEYL